MASTNSDTLAPHQANPLKSFPLLEVPCGAELEWLDAMGKPHLAQRDASLGFLWPQELQSIWIGTTWWLEASKTNSAAINKAVEQ